MGVLPIARVADDGVRLASRAADETLTALVGSRAIIAARAGLGRLERATTPGPDPAGEPSAINRGIRPT